jgi:hypothetical protein
MIPCVLTFIPETENVFIQKIFRELLVRKKNLSKGINLEKFKPYNLYGFLAW